MASRRMRTMVFWAFFVCSAVLFIDCCHQCILLGLHHVNLANSASRFSRISTSIVDCQHQINATNMSIAQSLDIIANANSTQFQSTKRAPNLQLETCQAALAAGKSRYRYGNALFAMFHVRLIAQQVDSEARIAYLRAKLANADSTQATMRRLVALLRGWPGNACCYIPKGIFYILLGKRVSEVPELTQEEQRNELIQLVTDHTGDALTSVQAWSSEELVNSVGRSRLLAVVAVSFYDCPRLVVLDAQD
eukprot:m.11096 g.11096  ORF g.11096 m.11096 type:complete len:249 (+) comp9741_c0_seq13:37-783(+)